MEATPVPQVPEALAAKLSDFEPFASGQTGVSFLATQTSSGYRGLLKVIPFAALDSSERVRVKRELRKQSRLTHEALPRIIDGGETASELWLFREFVRGESVAQRIRRLGKLEPQEAFAIAAQAASCLDELQRNGLLHRDVKPSHIVLMPRPQTPGAPAAAIPVTKLVDAGIASRLSTGSIFDLLGTPAYISPEQVMGKLVSFRSDLYALGCVMFEMLTGKPPFPSEDVRTVLEAHKNAKPPALPSELPSAVDALLASMLAKEPRQRPFSAQQVRRTLEPLLPEGTPLPAPGTRAPLGTPLRRTPVPAALPPVPSAGQTQDAGLTTDEIELVAMPPSLPSSRNTMPIRADELGDLEVLSSLSPGPQTVMLSDKELGELEVGGALPPVPKTMMLSDKELRDLAVGNSLPASSGTAVASADELSMLAAQPAVSEPFASSHPPGAPSQPSPRHPASGPPLPARAATSADPPAAPPSATAESASPLAEPAPVAEAAATASTASVGAASPTPEPGAASTGLGPGGGAAASPSAARSEAAPAEPAATPDAPGLTGLHETAPTQIFRPRDSESAPTRAAVPAVIAPVVARPAAARAPADVASRPPVRKRIPVPAIAAAAATVLILILIMVLAGGPDAPENPSASGPAPGATTPTDQRPAAQGEPAVPVAPALARAGAPPAPPTPGEAQPTAIATGDRPAPGESPAESPYIPELPPEDQSEQPPAKTAGSATTNRSSSAESAARRAAQAAAAYKTQGRSHYQARRFRQAAAAYQKAVGQNPNDAGAFAGLAASQLAGGDVDAAIAGYARAVRLQPASSGFRAALGRAYLQKGDRKRARVEYERALELDRNNLAARTALSQLK
jgi:serine/threonine protein kinase